MDLKFNAIDGDTNRISHHGPYQLDEDGAPVYVHGTCIYWLTKCFLLRNLFALTYSIAIFFRNPVGRTGLKGRGTLGKWGPNHAADPVVTR